MKRFTTLLAAMMFGIIALIGPQAAPAAAHNNAPARDICQVFRAAWLPGYYVSRATDFNYLGVPIVGCTFRQFYGNRDFACLLYRRDTGATSWVNCPTPPPVGSYL